MNDKNRRKSGAIQINRRNEICQLPSASSNFKKQSKNVDTPSNLNLSPDAATFPGGSSPSHGNQKNIVWQLYRTVS